MRYLTLVIKVVCVLCSLTFSINCYADDTCKISLKVVNSTSSKVEIKDSNGWHEIIGGTSAINLQPQNMYSDSCRRITVSINGVDYLAIVNKHLKNNDAHIHLSSGGINYKGFTSESFKYNSLRTYMLHHGKQHF